MFFQAFTLLLLLKFFPEPISKKIDIELFARMSEDKVITFLESCTDIYGDKAPLAVAVALIKAKPEKVFRVMTEFQKLKRMFPNLKEVKVLRRWDDKVKVKFKISVNFFFIKPSVQYTEVFDLSGKPYRIFGYIVKGPNRGAWRQWEIIPFEKNSLVIFSLCEDITKIPLASAIFKVNPHIRLGFPIASVWIVLDNLKKLIEGRLPER